MVEQDTLLQRGQRIDILHIGCTAGNSVDDGVDFLLGQGDQRQHFRGEHGAAVRDSVGWHDKGRDIPRGCLNLPGQISQNWRGEYRTNVQSPAPLVQPFDHTDHQQRVAA